MTLPDNNLTPLNIDIVIPAAGIGKRMRSDVPKQYIKIFGKTVLEHTVCALRALTENRGRIIIGIHPDDKFFDSLPISKDQGIIKVIGGKERSDTVLNALSEVKSEWVMVHDAARPNIALNDLRSLCRIISKAEAGAILASPVADTLKQTSDGEIVKTVSRNGLYRALTPQLIKTELLLTALNYVKNNHISVTDDASAIETIGKKVLIVEGRPDNYKITTAEDLHLMKLLISAKQAAN